MNTVFFAKKFNNMLTSVSEYVKNRAHCVFQTCQLWFPNHHDTPHIYNLQDINDSVKDSMPLEQKQKKQRKIRPLK